MKNLKYIFFIISVVTTFSCTTLLEDVKLPYQERIVIQSFISPQDTLLEVKLSRTRPVTGTFLQSEYNRTGFGKPVNGAIIEISDGQKKGIFQFQTLKNSNGIVINPSTGNQISQEISGYFLKSKDFPIVAGRIYTLTAKVPNLPDVTATCTIPDKQLIDNKDFSIIKGTVIDSTLTGWSTSGNSGVRFDRTYWLRQRFDVTVKDYISEENFYAVAYYTRTTFKYNDNGITRTRTEVNQQPYSEFIEDYKQDGGLLNFKKAFVPIGYYYENPKEQGNFNSNPIVNMLSIFVAITDKPYYQYNKSLINSGGINNDDPFSEAVLTYTNIKGGLGVFAGYNMTRVDIDLLKK